jgi:hypothetical protein
VCYSKSVVSLFSKVDFTNVRSKDCLVKNNYSEAKCQAQVEALYECCNAFYDKNGDDAKTVSCPKANLLRLKMKQLAQDKRSK